MKPFKSLSLLLLALSVVWNANAQTATEIYNSGKTLENAGNEKEAYAKYKSAIAKDANHFNALCGASYLASRLGNRENTTAAKTNYFRAAESYADKALALNSNAAEANYVKALAMGRIAQIAGSREAVAASRAIYEHADKAIKIDPTHDGAWLVLAKWHGTMANLSGAKRAAANMLFGGIPKGASNEKGLQCVQKAMQIKPTYVLYYYEMAKLYELMDNDAAAVKTLTKGLALPNTNIDDPQYKKEMKAMKAELS